MSETYQPFEPEPDLVPRPRANDPSWATNLIDSSIWSLELRIPEPPPGPGKPDNDDGDLDIEFDPENPEVYPEDDEQEGDLENLEDLDNDPNDELGWDIDPEPNAPKILPGLRATTDPHTVLREFDSWNDFVRCVSNDTLFSWEPQQSTTNRRSCSSHFIETEDRAKNNADNPWHGTPTFADALAMATWKGWPEGRKMLRDSFAQVLPKPRVFPSIEFDLAGAFPCVPLYCAGDPACMVVDPGSALRMAKPVVRIDFNHWTDSGVKPAEMIHRGAAVLSLADTLERAGISTELRIIGNSRGWTGKVFRYSIVYKKAGEPLDLDRAAFAIAHPATMRRLCFALMEQHKELKQEFEDGYGIPMRQPNDTDPNVVFVPPAKHGETPQSAKLAIEVAAMDLLNQLPEAAD